MGLSSLCPTFLVVSGEVDMSSLVDYVRSFPDRSKQGRSGKKCDLEGSVHRVLDTQTVWAR